MTKNQAIKKVQIATDKMIDLQDAGLGCDLVSRILEKLNSLENRMEDIKFPIE